jgi:transmembrane sensor
VQTAPGERTVVTLPDGSTAELNGTTTLRYPRGFNRLPWIGTSARTVRLDGEAFFSVTDRDRPFRVETANARVEVLGTEFNVRARGEEEGPQTRVAVTAGRVRVQAAGAGRAAASVVLEKAGQTSQVVGSEGRPTAPRVVDLKYVDAWRQGGFAMANASVSSILRELERRFGTSLRLRVPAVETDTMTLHYARDAELENVLHDICLIQNLSYRQTSQGYELVRNGS